MPLTPTRANLITGPGRIVRGTLTTHTKDNIGLKIDQRYSDVKPMSHGLIDRRLLGQTVSASFTPAGHVSQTLVDALWGYFANLAAGTSRLTTADVPTLIHSAAGGATIIASAITRLPDIILGPDSSIAGQMEIRGVVGTGMALSAASSLLTLGGNTTVVDTALTAASFKQQAYTAAFGSVAGFTSFEAQNNWKISFNVETTDIVVQGNVRDIKYTSIEVMASCIPVGPTQAQLATALGLSAAETIPGRAQATVASSLVITGTDTTTIVTIPLASMVGGGFVWGAGTLQQDEVGFYVSRGFTTGAQNALYTIATS